MSTEAPVRCFACGLRRVSLFTMAMISFQYPTPPFVCAEHKPGFTAAVADYKIELAAALLKEDAA